MPNRGADHPARATEGRKGRRRWGYFATASVFAAGAGSAVAIAADDDAVEAIPQQAGVTIVSEITVSQQATRW